MKSWQVIGEVVKAYIASGSPWLGFAALLSFLVFLTVIFVLAVTTGLPELAGGLLDGAIEIGNSAADS